MSLHHLLSLASVLCLTAAQAASVHSFVPENWKIVQAKSPDLDGDGRSDRLLVLEKYDIEGTRSLLLLKGVEGGFRMMARSPDGLLLHMEYGSDQKLEAGQGWFRIIQSTEGDWHWTDTHTFKLKGSHWLLTSLTQKTAGPDGFERTFQVSPDECARVELNSFSCGLGNNLWLKVVTSERAYFYPARRLAERTENYVVAGQRVAILDEAGTAAAGHIDLVKVRYISPRGKATEGYMRKEDLGFGMW